MRIALDCRTVTSPKTGDRTYAINLIRALAEVDAENEYLLYTSESTDLTRLANPRFKSVILPATPKWAWTPIAFPRNLRLRTAGIAHVQYIIPPFAPCPVVTTIHDISFRRMPHLFPLKHRILLNLLIPWSARRAGMLITGSEATKLDLMNYYGLPGDKIAVTPYAADESFRPMDRSYGQRLVREQLNLPVPYVLAVGVLQPRKNLPRLVRAYNQIAARIPHRLVIVGKKGWEEENLKQAISESPAGREPFLTGYVEDEILPALYAGAALFAFPSLYEGFGLPVLESMACGTPVLTSNVSSLPEVAGDAAALVNPDDVEEISRVLERLLLDEEERNRLTDLGFQQAAKFSWKNTARQTIEVYQKSGR